LYFVGVAVISGVVVMMVVGKVAIISSGALLKVMKTIMKMSWGSLWQLSQQTNKHSSIEASTIASNLFFGTDHQSWTIKAGAVHLKHDDETNNNRTTYHQRHDTNENYNTTAVKSPTPPPLDLTPPPRAVDVDVVRILLLSKLQQPVKQQLYP
jgi:hypothetical protein